MRHRMQSKRYLPSDIFDKYFQVINSPSPRAKIIALQKLNELLKNGYVLLPYDGDKLDVCLLNLLNDGAVGVETDDAVRRCVYRLCARRHNLKIRETCFKLLTKETSQDNKMSIIPILSQTMTTDEFDKSIRIFESNSGLSYNQIKLAQFARPGFRAQQLEPKFIYSFLDANDITALRFLSVIFNEQPCNPNNEFAHLNAALFSELAKHDDIWAQKYALGTFSRMDHFHINDLNIDPSMFLTLDAQPQKWIMTDIFHDRQFIRHNFDLVDFILSEHFLIEECDHRVKEGIAQGILHYGYHAKIAESIISWYALEPEASVKVLLRSYMMKYRQKNKEFEYVLSQEYLYKDSINEDIGLYLPIDMKKGKSFRYSMANPKNSYNKTEVKVKLMMGIINSFNKQDSGGGILVGGNITNSIISIENAFTNLEKEISSNGGEDAEELKSLLEDVKELISNIQSSRSIPKQRKLFEKLSSHASKHGWFYAEVVALIGQQIIAMLNS